MRKLALFLALLTVLSAVVVFPTSPKKAEAAIDVEGIKVGSFNIKNAAGGGNLDAIANQIRDYGLDVIGLQEVDYRTWRCPYDTMKELANRLGYHFAYFPAIDYEGGKYGVGTLSRWPILSTESKNLKYTKEPRVLSKCVIKTDDGYEFNFYNTHLDTVADSREQSMKQINDTVVEPCIITGDFNTNPSVQDNYLPTSRFVSMYVDGRTEGTFQSGSCLDNIYASSKDFTISDWGRVVNDVSDHYMIYTKVFSKPITLDGNKPVNLGDDISVKLQSVATGKFLAAKEDGDLICTVDDSDDATCHIWKLRRSANNIYSLYNWEGAEVLDVDNWGDDNGTKLQLWEDNGSTAQRFCFYFIDGGYFIRPIHTTTNQVVDVDVASGKAHTWSYSRTDNQKYNIITVGFRGELPLNLGDDFNAYIKNVANNITLNVSGNDTIFTENTDNNSLFQFIRGKHNSYKIKHVSTGKYLYVADANVEGTSVVLSSSATEYFVYQINGHFVIKPIGNSEFVLDMDATNRDLNIYWHSGTDELKTTAEQFDIVWQSAEDLKLANIGNSGYVYLQNFREGNYVSYNDENALTCNNGVPTTLWNFKRNSDGSYTFIADGTNLALDVFGAFSASFSKLQVYESNGTDAQKFFLYTSDDKTYYFRPAHTGKVLDCTWDGFIQLYQMNRTEAQRFGLTMVEAPTPDTPDDEMLLLKGTSSLVKDGTTLKKVKDKTSVSSVLSQFENGNILMKNQKGEIVSGEATCGTGYRVELVKNGVAVDSVVIVIKGDTDGDGIITSTDYMRVKNLFLKTSSFDAEYSLAADVDGDGIMTSTDYLKIKTHFLGTSNLFE